MLVLAILRLSDVFSSVLGVVYRLGLKQCVRRLYLGLFVMSYEKKRKAYVTTCLRACATHHIYAPIFYSLQTRYQLVLACYELVVSQATSSYAFLSSPE